jgi:GH25 family lysozyme M1 (1,4-beta-N-acetylmuramidase)
VAYPAVYEIWREPKGGDTNHRISQQWWDFTREINRMMGSLAGWEKARKVWSGWINSAANPEYEPGAQLPGNPDPLPVVEGVITVDNYVEILERRNGSSRIKIFDYLMSPPDLNKINPKAKPELFDEFHSVDKDGNVGFAPEGEKFYFPRLAKNGIGWLPDEILEFGVNLPKIFQPASAMRERAFGLDISKYDLRYSAIVRPVDFVIQRASYGLKRDERFEALWTDTRSVPIRGAYHYFNTGVPWKAQADHFLDVIAGRDFHFLALDYETYYNNLNAASAAEARQIMSHLRSETGKQVLLYCNPNVYENYLRPYGDWMAEWPLWISQWYSKWWFANRATGPRLPKERSDWAFWQYGGDYQHPTGLWSVPGYNEGAQWGVGAKHVDLDLFNGSPADLRAWVGIDGEELPGPPLPPSESDIRLDEVSRLEAYAEERRTELA